MPEERPIQDEQHQHDIDAEQHAASESDLDAELLENAGLEIDPEDLQPRPWVLPERNKVLKVMSVLTVLLSLVLLPPLLNVNTFRRRITQSVSASLGRPVHIDSVTLNVLPMPGFTLQNFVVEDDPAFSEEPVIRAETVKVTLRVWSLWRRRVEFSRISLDDPSLNLVHRADGRWNIESILLQASKIEAAPTAQQGAGGEPRFPYVEATGARVNVKMGLEKLPIALTEADLALWLTDPNQWRLRLEGHPVRTNTAATDTGIVRVQGTLGKASAMADVPVDLLFEWRAAPLGGVSSVLLGRDAGFRGVMAMQTTIQGTVANNKLDTSLDLTEVRRADFVPQHTLEASIRCTAQATATFHQINNLHCGWPSEVLTNSAASGLILSGDVPDIARWQSTKGDATLTGVPVSGLMDALRMTSRRIDPDLTAGGEIAGKLSCCANGKDSWSALSGNLDIAKATLTLGKAAPFVDTALSGDLDDGQVTLHPAAIDFGAPQPAMLEGTLNPDGLTLRLTGPVLRSRLLQLATALPQFGDGMYTALPPAGTGDTPIHIDLIANRSWANGQTWTAVVTKPLKGKKHSAQR